MGAGWRIKYSRFNRSKICLRRPERNNVIIYDLVGADVIEPYVRHYGSTVLHTRRELYYFRPALVALVRSFIFQQQFSCEYEDSFIRLVQPRLVISFIDNNMSFHQLARRHPKVKTILIQNGYRTRSMDLFGRDIPKTKGFVDHFFIFGAATADYYSQYLDAVFHPSGSLINNATPISHQTRSDSLVFISQFSQGIKMVSRPDGSIISQQEFYNSEKMVLPKLSKWCKENQMKLVISGTQVLSHSEAEHEFFGSMIPPEDFLLVPKESRSSSYGLIDQSKLFCFIDSTLGYEALLRGARGIAVGDRANVLKDESFDFCWPKEIDPSGPFWTNSTEYGDIKRTLDFAMTADQEAWNQIVAHTMSQVMEFDSENSVLRDTLSDLLDKSSEL